MNPYIERYNTEKAENLFFKYCEEYNIEQVRLFIEESKVNNDFALKEASRFGHTEIVKLLLEKGGDIHVLNDYALRIASVNGHIETVKLLLEKEADIHARNDEAIILASKSGHRETTRLLLEKGANPSVNNNEIIRLASENKYTEIVRMLLEDLRVDPDPYNINSELYNDNSFIMKLRYEKIIKKLEQKIDTLNYSPHSKEFPFGGIEVGKAWIRFNPERYIPMCDKEDRKDPESLDL